MWILYGNHLVNTDQLVEIEPLDDMTILGKLSNGTLVVLYDGKEAHKVFQAIQFNLQTQRNFFNIDHLFEQQ